MPAPDSNFEGFEADSLPTADLDFSVKNRCVANPDVVVDIKEGDQWVRIPVSGFEHYINKDGPADITRTAKVMFPAEWGGHSIHQYVNGFQAHNQSEEGAPYDQCRIFTYDELQGRWNVVHYGYVGGVGPGADSGTFKFWCYDLADLMTGIQVSKSFGEPTIAEVLEFVLNGTDEQGRAVGVNNRSVFTDVDAYIAGVKEVKAQKTDTANLEQAGPLQLSIQDMVDDIHDYLLGAEGTRGILAGQKRFQVNRHNMADLMNWFASEVGGKWHFEPTADGPVLFFDNTSFEGTDSPDGDIARRVFVEQEIIDDDDIDNPVGFEEREIFSPVDVYDNTALADIKPINTLYLYGESATFRQRVGGMGGAAAPGAYTEKYPWVKLQYPPLLERAGGYEYTAKPVESDKVTLEQAKNEAIEQFREHVAEQSEGEIVLKGEPHLLPYDYLRAIPVCNDTFPNANADPITYEVNGVKHTRKAGERYKTEARVSIVFNEEELNITARYEES